MEITPEHATSLLSDSRNLANKPRWEFLLPVAKSPLDSGVEGPRRVEERGRALLASLPLVVSILIEPNGSILGTDESSRQAVGSEERG